MRVIFSLSSIAIANLFKQNLTNAISKAETLNVTCSYLE